VSNDYIPARDADFNGWFLNISNYVADKTMGQSPAWAHIPEADANELGRAYSDWSARYEPTLHPHTPAQTAAKNGARKRAEAAIRPFVQRYLRWPPVQDEDRVNMRIPNRDAIRTEHHEVSEGVELEISLRKIRELLVNFWVKGSSDRAKPKGYDGAVVVWGVLDAPPERPGDLRNHRMASRTPHVIEFDETERGNLGAFSEIQSAVVP